MPSESELSILKEKNKALSKANEELAEQNKRYQKTITSAIKLLSRHSPRTALKTSLSNLLIKSLEDERKLLH